MLHDELVALLGPDRRAAHRAEEAGRDDDRGQGAGGTARHDLDVLRPEERRHRAVPVAGSTSGRRAPSTETPPADTTPGTTFERPTKCATNGVEGRA